MSKEKKTQTTQKTRENKPKEVLTAEANSNAGGVWVSHVHSWQGAGQPHYSSGILCMLQLMWEPQPPPSQHEKRVTILK